MEDRPSPPYPSNLGEAMQGLLSPCLVCRHYDWNQFRLCAAFPGGIPQPIWSGADRHRTAFPDDNGLRFEPSPTRP